jgi:hypothetical protein
VSVEPHLITDVESGEGRLQTHCLLFILVSHDCKLVIDVTVDVMKVKCSLVGLGRGDHLKIDFEVGVKSFAHEEWGCICGRVFCIVVCEFHEGE